jgi:uncharacterized RmlC-like cupin family protein
MLKSPDGFALIKPGQTYFGKQGITYGAGASTETVGAAGATVRHAFLKRPVTSRRHRPRVTGIVERF